MGGLRQKELLLVETATEPLLMVCPPVGAKSCRLCRELWFY